MMYKSDWRPSERLKRLAERRQQELTWAPPDDNPFGPRDMPIREMLDRAEGLLSGRAFGRLRWHIINRPSAGFTWWIEQYPTLGAFQDALRDTRHGASLHMTMTGPKIYAELRRVFLGEE